MLLYLVRQDHAYTMGDYLAHWAGPVRERIRVLSYESLPSDFSLEGEVVDGDRVLLSDLERLTAGQRVMLARRLSELREKIRFQLLNRPLRSMHRYELLRSLKQRGWNRSDIYRVEEHRIPQRFPVFLRLSAHGVTPLARDTQTDEQVPLIQNAESLGKALAILRSRVASEQALIVEHCDTADRAGVYRKYSAFRVGDRIVPRHVFFSRGWWIRKAQLVNEETIAEERRYLEANPHAERLMEIFQHGKIDYGRIDYGLLDGTVQTWEINTNPTILLQEHREDPERRSNHERFAAKFEAALEALLV